MALRPKFGGMSQKFGSVLSLCLLILAIAVSPSLPSIANGGNMPAVAQMAEPPSQGLMLIMMGGAPA